MADDLIPVRPLAATAGGQLRAEDVIGRDADVARAWRALESASVRLNEPRRLGKTSVLTKMADSPPAGWVCVKVSLQGVGTTDALAATLLASVHRHQQLPKKTRDAVRGVLASGSASAQIEGVTLQLNAAFRNDPLAALEASLANVSRAMQMMGDRLLLACDEVPDMLLEIARGEGSVAASNVLAVLRRFRDQDANSAVRWLLTGSVGMHHVLRIIGAPDASINDLDTVTLGPLSSRWACWLAESLLLGAGITPGSGAIEQIARISGGIPYLAHLIVAQARDQRFGSISADEVADLFAEAASDLDRSHQSTHLLTRLAPYYGPNTAAAEWLLDRLAERPADRTELRAAATAARFPLPVEADLRDLLGWLTQDHYLSRGTSGRYAWRYPPLMHIWQLRRR